MSCILTETTLVEGVDYELDIANGRIRFKSTGLLGPTLDTFIAGGGCGVQVDFCGSTPLHIPCPSKIDTCLPCDDDPVLNISAEDSDTDRFLFNFNTRQRPRLGFSFQSVGCKRFCFSEVSQLDADLCASLQVTECINDGFRDETGPTIGTIPPFLVPQPPGLFFNSAQTCTTFCPDGTSFGATIAAGLVANGNQAQANRIAHSLACRLSALQRVCIRTTSLPTACLGTSYSKQLLGFGGTGFRVTFDNFDTLAALCAPATSFPNSTFPYVWAATGLPTGLSVEPCSGMITGTPTQSGSFQVTLRAQDSIGSFQTKTLTLTVVEITDVANLPDATLSTAYSHVLTMNPIGTYFFQFFSGSPPSWLSINSSTGELTGTPDATGDFIFEISAESPDGTVCRKEFTLAVTEILAYWKLDEPSGTRLDSSGDANLQVVTATPSATGLIANAIDLVTTFPATEWLNVPVPVASMAFKSDGFTVIFWQRIISLGGPGVPRFQPFNIRFYDSVGVQIGQWLVQLNDLQFPFVQWTDMVTTRFYTFMGIGAGTWRMFALKYRPDGFCTLSINAGSDEVTPSSVIIPTPATADMRIFSEHGFAGTPGQRYFDEMAFFGRQLSAADLTFLYNGGAGRTFPDLP